MAAAMTSHHQKVGPRLFFYVLLLIADSVCVCVGGNPCWEVHSTVNEFALDFFFFFCRRFIFRKLSGTPLVF